MMQQHGLFSEASAVTPPTVSVATWNVNSANSRAEHIIAYLSRDEAPDILLLQEIKCTDENFPTHIADATGYICETYGQKSYNGVAILSKYPLSRVSRGLPGMEDDSQARFISADIDTGSTDMLHVICVYVPNGSSPDSEKFKYKQHFFTALIDHLRVCRHRYSRIICGGDYNAVFDADVDVYDPPRLEGTICCHPEERRFMRLIESAGYTDCLRVSSEESRCFTWWDYREGRRKRDEGYRIDHLMASPDCADMLDSCTVDAYTRDLETPSDHAPVRCVLRLCQ